VDDSRTRLIEAAEQLMREEGYAAVTSRRVASKAGLKPQLVHYHFRSMDELFIAIGELGAEKLTENFERALASPQPLHSLWELVSDRKIAVLASEFLALANHRHEIRAEAARYGKQFRAVQIELLSRVLNKRGISRQQFPPAAMALIMESIGRTLAIEDSLGLSTGHADVARLVKRYLDRVEPARNPRKPRREVVLDSSERG
jgi:AcrR family transcriptional regulator